MLEPEQHARHDDGRRRQQLSRVANAARRAMRIVAGIALHQRHHRHAGFETAQAQRQLGEEQQAGSDHGQPAAAALVLDVPVAACTTLVPGREPARDETIKIAQAAAEHDHIEHKIDATITTAMAITSRKPRRNIAPSNTSSEHRDRHLALQNHAGIVGPERIVNQVLGRVGRRERLVMTKSVAAKPSSTSTRNFAVQPCSSRSSIAIEPCPSGDSSAT